VTDARPMQAPKCTNLLDLVIVSLDSSLVSLLKLAKIGLASGKAVDEIRVLLLLSRSPLCLQLHLLLPCLHDIKTLFQHAQKNLAYIRSSIQYRCTNLFVMGSSLDTAWMDCVGLTQSPHTHQSACLLSATSEWHHQISVSRLPAMLNATYSPGDQLIAGCRQTSCKHNFSGGGPATQVLELQLSVVKDPADWPSIIEPIEGPYNTWFNIPSCIDAVRCMITAVKKFKGFRMGSLPPW